MGRKTHLLAGVLTLLIVIGAVTAEIIDFHARVQRSINAMANVTPFGQEINGDALQAAALQQNDLVVIYGSSEITAYTKEFGANIVFQNAPTGFTPFIIAHSAMTSLDLSQTLAAMGTQLKGKKIIISFTPTMFLSPEVPDKEFLGNFSTLHALELTYSDNLSMDLKARIVKRILDYPDAVKKDPILSFGAQKLVSDSPLDRIQYYLAYPIGRIDIAIIQLQDDYEVWKYLNKHPELNTQVRKKPSDIPWQTLLAKAEKEQIIRSNNNPDGVNNDVWNKNYKSTKPLPPGSRDQKFLDHLSSSKEWEDFDALMMVLKEEGAEPLILSRPINGVLYETRLGVSASAREAYYSKLASEVGKYGFPLVDFKDHDTDKYFSVDMNSHSSSKGWVYVDQAIDDFYHNRMASLARGY